MSKLTLEQMSFSDQEFDAMWSLWRHKGHYSVGILDYISLENRIFPNEKVYKNYAQAFAAVGRALDKFNVCKDSQ